MSLIIRIFSNYMLQCALLGWFTAQAIKVLLCLVVNKRLDFTLLFASGGMPSSHSASVCALAAAIAKCHGVDNPTFAVALLFAFIVMYDASGVRRASGEHAKILNKLVQSITSNNEVGMQANLKELIGHTPLEVIAGACLGVFIVLLY